MIAVATVYTKEKKKMPRHHEECEEVRKQLPNSGRLRKAYENIMEFAFEKEPGPNTVWCRRISLQRAYITNSFTKGKGPNWNIAVRRAMSFYDVALDARGV